MMRKIKYVMLVAALVMGVQVMNAQKENEGLKKVKRITAEKMAEMQANRIISELGLDDAKAAKFTEVYTKYMEELDKVRKDGRDFKKGESKEGEQVKPERKMPTDAEVDKMMKDRFAQSRKTLDIREKYYDEFRKFLSPKQVQKIFDQGEMNRGKFRKELNRRQGMKRPGDGQRPPMPKPQE
ncbi:MAG: DUF3826 domain-containing protein [Bacteroides sp.]|nr:DUF3826 domain-containing protein [Bacteroides sp.]